MIDDFITTCIIIAIVCFVGYGICKILEWVAEIAIDAETDRIDKREIELLPEEGLQSEYTKGRKTLKDISKHYNVNTEETEKTEEAA